MNATNTLTPIIVVLAVSLVGCSGEPTLIPSTYALYNAKDGTFECEYPEGWKAEGAGKRATTVSWSTMSSGQAMIRVKASTADSILGGGGSTSSSDLPPELEAVHALHTGKNLDLAEEEFSDYTELPGSPIVAECSLGPARVSEFTSSTSFGTKMHGYRATVAARDKGLNILCICKETDWKALQPMFDHTLNTLQRGTPEL